MKRAFLKISLWSLLAASLLPAGQAAAAPPSIGTSAVGAALIDVQSGRILYSQKGDAPMRIASLTKIMTAIVAIEHGQLTDTVKVSKNAFGKEGSSIYLKLGEEMNLKDMLYGLMLRSGNDAATAIAEHVGGSVEGFVHLMNEEAQLIGMEHSHFHNPSGLDDGNEHYASANDMAKLTAYALKNPVFREIVATKLKKAPNPNESWDYTWYNKNKMLTLFEGADGVKTGYTKLAKRCLVSSATRGGQQLAVVTLNDPNDWDDHAKLLSYGFQYYPLDTVASKGQAVPGQPWVVGRSLSYPLAEGEQTGLTSKLELADSGGADYRLGERGQLHYFLNGQPIGSLPLYEKGSPRLAEPDRLAFVAGEGDGERETLAARYLFICRMLFSKLFAVVPDAGLD